MRWVQRLNEETGKYEFQPIDEAARNHNRSAAIHGDITSFVSPVDGSVITDRAQLRAHNSKHGVVNFHEFDGQRPPKEKDNTLARKKAMYEIITRVERGG
jgi:hypothetical protein